MYIFNQHKMCENLRLTILYIIITYLRILRDTAVTGVVIGYSNSFNAVKLEMFFIPSQSLPVKKGNYYIVQ